MAWRGFVLNHMYFGGSGLASSWLSDAVTRPWPRGEILIATAIGVDASEIWPSRYFDKQGMRIGRAAMMRIKNAV